MNIIETWELGLNHPINSNMMKSVQNTNALTNTYSIIINAKIILKFV